MHKNTKINIKVFGNSWLCSSYIAIIDCSMRCEAYPALLHYWVLYFSIHTLVKIKKVVLKEFLELANLQMYL